MTTPEQTIADLVAARVDKSLVAGVLAEAETFDADRLVALLSPLASRNGFKPGDGEALFTELERLAHRDADSLAKAVSATALAQKIVIEYFKAFNPAASQAIHKTLVHLPTFQATLDPKVEKQLLAAAGRVKRFQESNRQATPSDRPGDESETL